MNINQKIIDTLSTLGLPVKESIYTGNEEKWIVFNYADDRGDAYANDAPTVEVVTMHIHLYVPLVFNYPKMKKDIRSLLFEAGFSYATVSTEIETDTRLRHLIFECEYVEGREV